MQNLAPGKQPTFMHFILPLASLCGNFCAIISQRVMQQKRSAPVMPVISSLSPGEAPDESMYTWRCMG
jgi:hypothetical protein